MEKGKTFEEHKMNDFAQKVLTFATALSDVYKDEDSRCLQNVEPLTTLRGETDTADVTEDFTAMLVAIKFLYADITDDTDTDLVGFTHMLNRLAIQHCIKNRED